MNNIISNAASSVSQVEESSSYPGPIGVTTLSQLQGLKLPVSDEKFLAQCLKCPVKMYIAVITPALAMELLGGAANYRPAMQTIINKYAGIMRDRGWKISQPLFIRWDPIRKRWVVQDGGHRLGAVVVSNTPQAFIVIEGLDDDSIPTLDVGKGREPWHILRGTGVLDEPQYRATILRRILVGNTAGSTSVPSIYVRALYSIYEPVINLVVEALPSKGGMTRSAVVGAFARAFLFYPKSRHQEIKDIALKLRSGIFGKKDKALKALHHDLVTNNWMFGGSGMQDLYGRTALAIKATLENIPNVLQNTTRVDGITKMIGLIAPKDDPFELPEDGLSYSTRVKAKTGKKINVNRQNTMAPGQLYALPS